jgi:outer membrane protein assembly factor BamA
VELTELRHNAEDQRDLLITVEEAPPTTVGYGGGLEGMLRVVRTEQDGGVASQKFEVAPRAFFEIGRRNLFGKNRSVNLSTSVSLYPKDSPFFGNQAAPTAGTTGGFVFAAYRVQGTFREPRLFDTAAVGLLTGTIERQIRSSFNLARRGVGAQVARQLTRSISVSGGYQIQRTELLDVSIDPADQPLIDRAFTQVRLSSFSASGSYNTRDDALDPSTGEYLSANGQIAARAIGSEIGFVKSSFMAQAFRTVPHTRRVVLAGNARLGLATGFPRDVPVTDAQGNPVLDVNGQQIVQQGVRDLPQAERFFAGGDSTVRGFALDRLGTADTISQDGFPIGGNALVIFNGEVRVPLLSFLGVVAFVDTGNVFVHAVDVDLGQLRSAVGYGVRVKTPVGPIRIDWGYKMDTRDGDLARPDSFLALGGSAVYLSFGQAF